MYSFKKRFLLENMQKKDELSARDYEILYRYSYDLSYELRSDVAELLCDHYTPKAEKILRRMTYDCHYIVRLNAIDSLCIGRSKKTLKRLYMLTKSKDELIRMYAYMSYNDIIRNRNVRGEKREYTEWVQKAIKKDSSDKVKLAMYGELYKQRVDNSFNRFSQVVKKVIKEKNVKEVWLILNVLEDIMDSRDYDYDKAIKILKSLRSIANPKQLKKLNKMLLY